MANTTPDTLFGLSFLAVSIDHPVSKSYKNNKDLLILKMSVQKLAQLKRRWQMQKRLVLKQT